MILCCLFYVASAVPREGKAYRTMPALACGSTLDVLRKGGWVAKDQVLNDLT